MPLEHYKKYQEHPEGRWIISYEDCERLQKIVKENNCKTILDLGSGLGASTYALAEATEGKVWAIEQFEKCGKIAKELLPAHLQDKVEFFVKPPHVLKVETIPYRFFSSFNDLPKENWDLIVVDGPGPFLAGMDLVKLPNGDIFEIFPDIKTGCIIYVDTRLETVILMLRYLFPYLDIIKEEFEVGQQAYHVCKRNGVKYSGLVDKDFFILKNLGYFKSL